MPTGQVFRWHLRIMMQPMRDQRRGGEAELLGAQQRGDGHVAAGLQFAVGLDADAPAQVVQHQHLLRFGQPSSHGMPACLSEVSGEAPGAARIAR